MTEDYAKYLRAEANSGIAALHQFRLLYSDDDQELHVFFEGEEDSLFYMPEIRRQAGIRRTYTYVCSGKRNVVAVREDIGSSEYDIQRCLFFIDRDFDDYLGTQVTTDDRTYLTDNYSIESDIVRVQVLEVFIEDFVKISRADPEFARIVADFGALDQSFAKQIKPFMAWSIAAKQAGSKPNFNNIDLGKVLIVGANGQVSKRAKGFDAYVRRAVGSGAGATLASTLAWFRQLHDAQRKRWIRGKFYYWFFQKSLLALIGASSARREAAGGKAWKVPAALREARLFEMLGGRAPPPPSLTAFLTAALA